MKRRYPGQLSGQIAGVDQREPAEPVAKLGLFDQLRHAKLVGRELVECH
jgi:hypothetical protein